MRKTFDYLIANFTVNCIINKINSSHIHTFTHTHAIIYSRNFRLTNKKKYRTICPSNVFIPLTVIHKGYAHLLPMYETGSRRRGRFIYLLCEQGRQHRRHLISCVPTFVWSPQSTPAPPQGAPGQDAYCRQAWKFNADLSPQALASERGGRGAWSGDMGVAWRCLMQFALHYTPPWFPPLAGHSLLPGCLFYRWLHLPHTHNGLINSALARGFSHKRFNSFLSLSP